MSTSPDAAERLANRAAGLILLGLILTGVVVWLSFDNHAVITVVIAPIACFYGAGKAIVERRKLPRQPQ